MSVKISISNITMQAHSNGLKCSNGIFLLKKKPTPY